MTLGPYRPVLIVDQVDANICSNSHNLKYPRYQHLACLLNFPESLLKLSPFYKTNKVKKLVKKKKKSTLKILPLIYLPNSFHTLQLVTFQTKCISVKCHFVACAAS